MLLICLFALPSAASAAGEDSVPWDKVLELFPDARRETYDKPIYGTQHKYWLEFVISTDEDSNGKIFPMIYDEYGKLMQENRLEYAHICTGEHIAYTSKYDSGDLMMVSLQDVVIRGDVLGTGRLTINQVVCLAQVLTGQKELTGPYLEAADVNKDGKPATIADIVMLTRWLLGFYS